MSDTKQTWRLIVKKTGEVIIKSDKLDDKTSLSIKAKSMDFIKARKSSNYRIQYFENDRIVKTDALTVYFS
jgi:hypothetical protein